MYVYDAVGVGFYNFWRNFDHVSRKCDKIGIPIFKLIEERINIFLIGGEVRGRKTPVFDVVLSSPFNSLDTFAVSNQAPNLPVNLSVVSSIYNGLEVCTRSRGEDNNIDHNVVASKKLSGCPQIYIKKCRD